MDSSGLLSLALGLGGSAGKSSDWTAAISGRGVTRGGLEGLGEEISEFFVAFRLATHQSRGRGVVAAPRGGSPTMNGKTAGSSTQTELVDIEWVARRLGVKVRHVRRLVGERRIPFVKWGHLLRFDPIEIEAWINGLRRPPAA